MARTTADLVRQTIGTNPDVSLDGFIRTANAIVTDLDNRDTDGRVPAALLIEIETYLAAHFYALFDPQAQSESYGASATYQGQTGEGLRGTWWGQQAISMDLSGYLAEMADGVIPAKIHWLGKPASTKIPIWQRD